VLSEKEFINMYFVLPFLQATALLSAGLRQNTY